MPSARTAREYASRGKRYNNSLKEQYPMVFAWGDDIEYLSHEESITAPVEDRIKSVWPFLVAQVLRFAATLRPRDLVNYDPEDVLGELWIALVERDDKWEPARGRYLTFAGKVVANELHSIRDRSHTVHSPKNTGCRLKQYEAESRAGSISDRRRKTFQDILRVLGEQEAIDEDPLCLSTPAAIDLADRQEQLSAARVTVQIGLTALSSGEAMTVSQAFGLYGGGEKTDEEIAEERGLSVETVKRAKLRAVQKMRERLDERGALHAAE